MSKRRDHYTVLLMEAIGTVLEDIGMEELQEGDNLTDFFHATANLAPAMVYGNITGNNVDVLEFNHIANRLIYQNKVNK